MKPRLLEELQAHVGNLVSGWHKHRCWVDGDSGVLQLLVSVPLEVLEERIQLQRGPQLTLPDLDEALRTLLKRRATGGLCRFGKKSKSARGRR